MESVRLSKLLLVMYLSVFSLTSNFLTQMRGRSQAPGDAFAPAHVEEENESMTYALREKIGSLKHISISIGNEVKEHNRMLSDMHTDFDSSESLLKTTMNRVVILGKSNPQSLILYLFLFAAFVFFLCWLLMKLR